MVLGNTDRPVERIGIELLGAPAPDMPADGRTGVLATVVALLLTAVTLPSLAAPAGRHTGGGRHRTGYASPPGR